jgi:hypothetical protein
MKIFLGRQAALQAVDQREDLGVGHFCFCCSKEKRPPERTDGRDLCSCSE